MAAQGLSERVAGLAAGALGLAEGRADYRILAGLTVNLGRLCEWQAKRGGSRKGKTGQFAQTGPQGLKPVLLWVRYRHG